MQISSPAPAAHFHPAALAAVEDAAERKRRGERAPRPCFDDGAHALDNSTAAELLGVSAAETTIPRPPKWWQWVRRLSCVALLVGLAACEAFDWPAERELASRALTSAGMTAVTLGESTHLGPCGREFCRATRFSALNSVGRPVHGVVCRRENGPAFIAFD